MKTGCGTCRRSLFHKNYIIRQENGKVMEKRIAKISVSKSGGTASKNGVTFRATLPTAWVRAMGLGEQERQITLSFDGEKITIEKQA